MVITSYQFAEAKLQNTMFKTGTFFVPATRTYRDSSFKLKLTVVKVLVDIPILDSVNICWSENGGLWEKLPHQLVTFILKPK